MHHCWILEGHTPVPVDIVTYGEWLEGNEDARRVAKWGHYDPETRQTTVAVSTVFLGLDHALGGGPPVLFETMVFGDPLDMECERYYTWEEAEAGHQRMVERVRAALGEA